MIITLTANPSIDRTAVLTTTLTRGAVHRLHSVGTQAAGKGVNISRAAVTADEPTLAVLPAHRHDPYVADLDDAGVPVHPVQPAGGVRINLSITEPDGTTTKLNSPGDTVGAADLDRLADALLAEAAACTDGRLGGARGLGPAGHPRRLVRQAGAPAARLRRPRRRRHQRRAAGRARRGLPRVGPASPQAEQRRARLDHRCRPRRRSSAIRPPPAAAAQILLERGVGAVLATLGGAGAVLVDGDGAWLASPPATTVVSTVGAGDSSLFGYLLGDRRRLDGAGRLALAVAYGSAAAGLPGTTIPLPEQVDPTTVDVRRLAHTTER